MKGNPWKLSPRECEVMAGLAAFGLNKVVALEMGVSDKTVCEFLRRAKQKMAARTVMTAVVEFDRWARAQ